MKEIDFSTLPTQIKPSPPPLPGHERHAKGDATRLLATLSRVFSWFSLLAINGELAPRLLKPHLDIRRVTGALIFR